MKKVLIVIALMISFAAIYAQNPVAKGQAQINAGVGLSSWGVPVYFGIDYGVHKDITMGGEISYRGRYREQHGHDYYNHSIVGISGNANYHFNHILEIPRDWDFYAGLNLGYYIWNSPSDYDYNDRHVSGLGLGAQVGGRYYFTDSIGINLEFGGSNAFSGGKLGLSFKL